METKENNNSKLNPTLTYLLIVLLILCVVAIIFFFINKRTASLQTEQKPNSLSPKQEREQVLKNLTAPENAKIEPLPEDVIESLTAP